MKQDKSPEDHFEAPNYNNNFKPYEAQHYNNFKSNRNKAGSKPFYTYNNTTVINDPNEYYEEEEVATLEIMFEFPEEKKYILTFKVNQMDL